MSHRHRQHVLKRFLHSCVYRRGMVIIGNPVTLSTDPSWNALLHHVKAKGLLLQGTETQTIPPTVPLLLTLPALDPRRYERPPTVLAVWAPNLMPRRFGPIVGEDEDPPHHELAPAGSSSEVVAAAGTSRARRTRRSRQARAAVAAAPPPPPTAAPQATVPPQSSRSFVVAGFRIELSA